MPALIFDIDGTFAETEEVHRRAFNETFAAAGLGWHWDRPLYKRLLDVTGGKERLRFFIDGWSPPGGAETIARIPALHADKTIRYTALIDAGAATPRPGVVRLIGEARAAGWPVAIATTTSLPNITSLMKATFGPDGTGTFAAVGAGDVVARKKPAPDIYLHVLNVLGVRPEEAIAFEDSENGIASAMGAGIATVITPSAYTEDQSFPGAMALLSDLGEPGQPYRHLGGAGAGEAMVTPAALERWLGAGR
jgi:beta-phosphoglucomutase-like phosphatase (HAD superfamily)